MVALSGAGSLGYSGRTPGQTIIMRHSKEGPRHVAIKCTPIHLFYKGSINAGKSRDRVPVPGKRIHGHCRQPGFCRYACSRYFEKKREKKGVVRNL